MLIKVSLQDNETNTVFLFFVCCIIYQKGIYMNTEKLYTLSEKADKILQSDIQTKDLKKITEEVKTIINENPNGYIGIAQINPRLGDLKYNSKKIGKYISYATSIGLDTLIFPELSLVGYPLEDTIKRHPIIVKESIKWLNELARLTKETTTIVGFIEPDTEREKYYNSLAIMKNGTIMSTVRKSVIPAFSSFNDNKYFTPASEENKNFTINHTKYNLTINEECYSDKIISIEGSTNPLTNIDENNTDILVNCSAIPTNTHNLYFVETTLSNFSKNHSIYSILVNQVGSIDNISFQGSSKVFDKNGKLLARAKEFEEHLLIVNPTKNIGKIYPSSESDTKKEFSLDYEDILEKTYKTVIQGIKDYFNKNGIKRACLGLSGGLDSTVCAVLLVDALGKENVFGISMPSKITSNESRSDAEILAKNLNINYVEMPIKEIVKTTKDVFKELFSKVEQKWDYRYKKSFTTDNIQARTRAMYLWGISNEFESCIPIATSDKSEAYMGYATINGDMSGGFAPIADITKTKLFALARWLNKNRTEKNVIPDTVIKKRPGAELAIDERTGKPLIAEDALMPYEFLDEAIWRLENKHESYNEMLTSKFIYETTHTITIEEKKEWLNKFFKRKSNALYKGSIMPPSVTIDSLGINKYNYKQPITSSHINYKEINEAEIKDTLKNCIIQ